jgi:ribonucleotide reductase beta subunit family protein with ferritin-like domain
LGAYLFGQEISENLSKYERESDDYDGVYEDIRASVYEIILEAVSIEGEFADCSLSEDLEDLNATGLKTYARLIEDNLLAQLSYSPNFKVRNHFTWLDDISMEQKGNFYEVRIGSYEKKSLSDVINWRKLAGLIEDKIDVYENPEDVDF